MIFLRNLLIFLVIVALFSLSNFNNQDRPTKDAVRSRNRSLAGEGRTSNYKTQITVKPYRFLKMLDSKKSQEMIDLVHNINLWILDDLSFPKKLDLFAVDQFANAYFDTEEMALTLPYQFRFEHHTKHPLFTKYAWAHEYGHALFFENIKDIAPRFAQRYLELTQKARTQNNDKEALQILYQEKSLTKVEYKAALKELELLNSSWRTEYEQIGELLAPFDEYAADVVAAIHFSNSETMNDSLFYSYDAKKSGGDAEMRSFERYKPSLAKKGMAYHTFFYKARTELWKYCLNRPRRVEILRRVSRGKLLSLIFNGMGQLIEQRYQQQKFSYTVEEHEKVNDLLWESIDANMLDQNSGEELCGN